MRKIVVKAYGLIREIDLSESIDYLDYLQKNAKDFEIIEYREEDEKNVRDYYF